MTATAPQPGRSPRGADARAAAPPVAARPAAARRPAPTAGQAQPPAPARVGGVSGRRLGRASNPNKLRLVRGLAAAACLLPGTAAFAALGSAGTPSAAASPAIVRAQLARDEATVRTTGALAWASGTDTDRQATAGALAAVANDLGRLAVVRPDWGSQLDAAQSQLAAKTAPILGALGTKAADPSTAATLQANLAAAAPADAGLPTLNDATGNDTRRTVVYLFGGLTLLALAGASVWLARKTHRVINPGLAAGLLGTVAVTVLAGSTLGAMVTSTSAEAIAGARVDAAGAVADEAGVLLAPTTGSQAATDRADALQTGLAKLTSAGASAAATNQWTDFANSAPALTTTPTAATITQRVAALKSLDATLANQQSATGHGVGDYAVPIGYALLAVSILSATAAWTGVGRRVSEYR